MKLILYGRSSTGKSTLAKEFSRRSHLSVRHCGDEVTNAARALGLSVEDLPLEVHRKIDDNTCAWFAAQESCVVDGRFLDHVLSAQREGVMVHVTCALEERIARWAKRAGRSFDEVELGQLDRADDMLVATLYGVGVAPTLTLDTSRITVGEAVELLEKTFG